MATQSTAIVAQRAEAVLLASTKLTREQVELLKRTVAKGTTDDEFALFVATADRMGLDPFAKQIHAVKRYSKRENREVMSIQVGIDGFRLAAIRTGEHDGTDGPHWCGPDGVWKDVWLADEAPAAARFVVYRKGCSRPFTAVATYASYVQTDRENRPNPMWQRGSDFMLAKCAEALALRRGFPAELSGAVIAEEIGNVDDEAPDLQPLTIAPSTTRALPAPSSSKAAAIVDATSTERKAPVIDERVLPPPELEAANDETSSEPSGDLSDDDVALLAEQIKNAKSGKERAAIAADIAKMDGKQTPRTVTEVQRRYLLKVYKDAGGSK